METLERGFVPKKTLEQKLEQIQSEKASLKKMVLQLMERETQVRRELKLQENNAQATEYLFI